MKYIISYDTEFGHVSAEIDDPDDLLSANSKLQSMVDSLSNKSQRKAKRELPAKKLREKSSSISKVPETSVILRELESNIFSSKFFEEPRTTGETREKLHEVTGKYFASRKVSQALGILKDRGKLRRRGKRNYFQYSLS